MSSAKGEYETANDSFASLSRKNKDIRLSIGQFFNGLKHFSDAELVTFRWNSFNSLGPSEAYMRRQSNHHPGILLIKLSGKKPWNCNRNSYIFIQKMYLERSSAQ